MKNLLKSIVVGSVTMMAAVAGAVSEYDHPFWGWNVSAGANFGFGLKTHLKTSSAAAFNAMPRAITTTDKKVYDDQRTGSKFERVDYSNGGFVDPNSEASIGNPNETINWGLPVDADSPYALRASNPYTKANEIVSRQDVSDTERAVAYGASIDLSHILYVNEDGSWGVDVGIGLSWMRSNKCYKNEDGLAYSQSVEEGDFVTTFQNDWIGSGKFKPNADNTWGGAAATKEEIKNNGKRRTPLDMTTATYDYKADSTKSRIESLYINTYGDYEEWELSLLLRPWYDINDWLCVHGTLGAGLSRSSFEYEMEAIFNGATVYRSSNEFTEWDIYGIAGAGVMLRLGDFDISCDGLFRWCQDDMEIRSKDVNGTLERPWAVVRLGLSYAF